MLTPISDITKFFRYEKEKSRLVFIGEDLNVLVPKRYSVYNLLIVEDTVRTLGIVGLEIDNRYSAALLLLSEIEMAPSEVTEVTIEDKQYLKLNFKKEDVFLVSTKEIQNSSITYSIFVEFITRGKLPYFLSYKNIAYLFDSALTMTSTNLDMDHVIFEIVYAHLHRDKDDITKFYRNTDMKKPPQSIPLRSVNFGPTSTTAKLLGSYFDDGLTATLISHSDTRHDIEDYLRS